MVGSVEELLQFSKMESIKQRRAQALTNKQLGNRAEKDARKKQDEERQREEKKQREEKATLKQKIDDYKRAYRQRNATADHAKRLEKIWKHADAAFHRAEDEYSRHVRRYFDVSSGRCPVF